MQPTAVCEGYVPGIISVLQHNSICLWQAGLRVGRFVRLEGRTDNWSNSHTLARVRSMFLPQAITAPFPVAEWGEVPVVEER
jgi:hypothetical protein